MSAKLQIESIFVAGYGAFRDKEIGSLAANFILIYGRNEVGKSTLFSFLRGMISGFPSLKKKLENRFLPINGGEYGGEVKVRFNESEFMITKTGKDLAAIDINGANKEDLQKLIARLDRDHYKAIFAFDLMELTSLKLLNDTSLNERLFSSFFEGSEDLVSSALKDIDKSKQELFRSRSNGKIDYLYQEYQEGEQKIMVLEQELQERAEKASLLNGLDVSISKKRAEIEILSERMEVLKDIKEAGQIVNSLKKEELLREELNRLPIISLEEEKQYRELISEQNLLNQELKAADFEIESETEQNEVRESKLRSVSIESIKDYEKAALLYSRLNYARIFNLFIIGLLGLLFNSSIISVYTFTLLVFVNAGLGFVYYFYANKRYQATSYPLFDFASILGQELPYDVDILKKEYHVLKNNYELNKEKLNRLKQRKTDIQNRREDLSRHSLGHLLESDVIELKSNAIKQNECLTRIKTIQETLNSLNLSSNTILESNSDSEVLSTQKAKTYKELDQLLEERGSIKANLLKLASSSEVQELRLEVFSIKSEIERLLFSWRVDAVSEYLLKEAFKRVGESAFNSVSVLASDFLKRITLGAYLEVSLSEKGDTVLVKDKNSRKLEPAQLSQGTVEQLYLSLRLALVKVCKDSIGQLPILLDDVLVNFDKQRAIEIIKILKEVSKDNQVFYFTCHEWIRDLFFNEVGNEGRVVEL